MRESIKRKQEEVKLLSVKIKESISSVAFEYPGLSVAEFTELRTLLRDSGCDAKVVKNNISKRASEMAGYNNFASVFKGPKAIAFSSCCHRAALPDLGCTLFVFNACIACVGGTSWFCNPVLVCCSPICPAMGFEAGDAMP